MGNAEPMGFENILKRDDKSKDEDENYDIYVIGLQESTYSVKHLQGTEGVDDCISHLESKLTAILGKDYYLVIHYFFEDKNCNS